MAMAALPHDLMSKLCVSLEKNDSIPVSNYDRYNVKRGLRNSDGTGVMAGLTKVCSVEGYYIEDGEKLPREGRLTYRGVDVRSIVSGCREEKRFGYEECIWLLLFGSLPTAENLNRFCELLSLARELPKNFIEDIIMRSPSPDVMNQLGRCVLALYAYDENADDTSIENVLWQSIRLIAQMPLLMSYNYQVKRRNYYRRSMYIHPVEPEQRTAEVILNSIRHDKQFTAREAELLDLCLMVHADHGGGNNSAFATRVLSSSGTDTYSAIAAGIGALKGPKHGGANLKVIQMLEYMKNDIRDCGDDEEIADFLKRVVRREAGDGSGLIYGMGHAVYTLSDPRAIILKREAEDFCPGTGFEDDLKLLEAVERLTPGVFAAEKGSAKKICANVDLYSGLIYRMLRIPVDLYTPLFTVARTAGWCAHRIEEIMTSGRIIRPAYKSLALPQDYIPLESRTQTTETLGGRAYIPQDER